MSLDPAKNFVKTKLTGLPYATGDTAISVEDGSEMPDPATDGAFNITAWDTKDGGPADGPNREIMRVTARTGNDLTVTRAQEGTTALAYATGETYRVISGPTAKMFSDIKSAIENSSGQVSSVFARTGDIVAETGDYSFSQLSGSADYSQLPISSAQVTNWESAFNKKIVGVSGSGDGTLTLTHEDTTTSTVDLSHSHGYDDLPISSAQVANWEEAYNKKVTGVSGNGDGTLTITFEDLTTVTTDLSHTHSEYLTTESDPTVPSHVKNITTTQISNWGTAYNKRVTGVSGNGDGTLTITFADATTVTTSLAHSHSEYIQENTTPSFNAIDLANKEMADYNVDGRLYWDLSDGLYIKSSNANYTGAALQWSRANVIPGTGISVSYDASGKPTVSLSGDSFNNAGTYGSLRAQATTKGDVGLGSVDNVGSATSATGNTNAQRDSSGDIHARLFRSGYGTTNGTIGYIMTQVNTGSNNYIRPSTPSQIKSALSLSKSDVGLGNVPNSNNLSNFVNGPGYITSTGITTGYNTDGKWIKFDEGVMICWKTLGWGSASSSTTQGLTIYDWAQTWNFPQAFVDDYVYVNLSMNIGGQGLETTAVYSVSSTAAGLAVNCLNNATIAISSVIAVGRWK